MMFLEYFIWGAWYVTMTTYMNKTLLSSGTTIGLAYMALSFATIISPIFVGLVADRFFSAQRIMGLLHLLGAAILLTVPLIKDPTLIPWVVFLYSLFYMPTIALSNSVAFYQMVDPGKQFPKIRVFGTLGWIVAGFLVGGLNLDASAETFYIAAGASALLGLFSFLLPNTPPKGKSADASAAKALGADGFVLLRDKPYLIFFIAAILVCIPLSFYYGFANGFLNELNMKNAALKMTLGQFSEALFIMAIPFLFYRAGVKNMILMGMVAWILRYLCFAYGNLGPNLWMLYAGIVLHGVCYDFFFVTGYMYTEKKAGEKIKNAAQQMFTIATYGVGMVIGTLFSGFIVDKNVITAEPPSHNWTSIWWVPAIIAAVVLLYFMLFFREKRQLTVVQQTSLK
jgi:nucleoside transporter